MIKAVALHLQSESAAASDYIIVPCTQDVPYILTMLSCQLLGAVPVPVEKGAGMERLRSILEDTHAQWMIGEPPKEFDQLKALHVSGLFTDCRSLYNAGKAVDDSNFPLPDAEAVAEILFTTGTTGKPKGIIIQHSSNAALAENVTNGVHMEKDNVELIPMPLSHSHGLRRTYSNLYNGSTAVIGKGILIIKNFFSLIEKYSVTSIDISPSMLNILFRLSKDKIAEYRGQLRYIQLGSAPLTEENKQRLMEDLPDTRLYNFYGTTEAGCSCILDFNSGSDHKNCVGKPTVNARFKFVDENRKEIHATAEHPGYIATAGSQNMAGYLNAPDLTRKACEGGFIYTSDLGYMDENGNIYCLGRKDDVINCGGIKIAPDEIEMEAVKYTGIKDCACIPVPDKIQGQVPKLFISLSQPQDNFDMHGFRSYLSTHLDRNEVPKSLEILDEIPRTYNGKIQRKKLIQQAAESATV
ncbi:MAG: class I adenylate-forming enzyme family protein [Eubacterium sp.]